MSSTDLRVVLPPPRRAWLRAFCLATSGWVGLAVAALAPFGLPGKVLSAAVVVVAAVAVAAVRPGAVVMPYRAWNKAARIYARGGRTVLLLLCYGVITSVGVLGSRLQLSRPAPNASLWYRQDGLPLEAYASQDDRPGRVWPKSQWTSLALWAVRSGNAWAVVLVPFLALIAVFDSSDRQEFPPGIYTLF
jgi:hypothetical protein